MSDPFLCFGFPPPLLGDQAQRLKVFWDHPFGLVVEKPAGVLVLADNWFPHCPVLTEAINYQAAREKSELGRLGVGPEGVRAIVPTEPELAGAALLAKDPAVGEWWSNAYGSGRFSLAVRFLSAKAPAEAETLECDLPIARHAGRERRMLVSHRTGKKTVTRFRRLQQFGPYSLWEARTDFLRVNQIPLHAFELGLAVVGDRVYADEPPLYLSRLKRSFRLKGDAPEAPLYPGMVMHLAELSFPLPEGDPVCLELEPPKRFVAVLRNLERYG
jgi:23S rRNA-/tRNA-specific pseudouridylate synthase